MLQNSGALYGMTVSVPGSFVPQRKIRGIESKIMHKDVIDSYRLKKRKELEQSLPSVEPVDVDMPITDMEDPYADPPRKCILCTHNVDLDYKNTRLLSQFVSPYTGRIYGRQITGLCLFMQRRVARLIKRSRFFGFMPCEHKDLRFVRDPKLFDPFRRKF